MRTPRLFILDPSRLLLVMLLIAAMVWTFSLSWFRQLRFFLFLSTFLTLCLVWLGLSGCTPIDLVTGDGKTDSTGYATLQVTNNKEQDPGPLGFRLCDSNAIDAQSAVKVMYLGVVAESATVSLKVPAGCYKLAFDDNARVWPMTDKDSTELTWPKLTFVKGATYHVLIHSEDTRTIWEYDIPVTP